MSLQVHGSRLSTLMGRLRLLSVNSWQHLTNWLCTAFDNGFSTRCGIWQCPELAAAVLLLVMKLDACGWHRHAMLPALGREAEQYCSRYRSTMLQLWNHSSKSTFSVWSVSNWKSRWCLCVRVVACRALESCPLLDFAQFILCASLTVKFHPGISVLTQEFQPNPILLRRDKREVNSRVSPQTDD